MNCIFQNSSSKCAKKAYDKTQYVYQLNLIYITRPGM